MISFFCVSIFFIIPSILLATYDEGNSKEYWYLSNVAYCASYNISQWKIGPLNQYLPQVTDIRVYENTNTDNQAYLAYNIQTNTIILTFRGSKGDSINNWLFQNLNFFKTSYSKCSKCEVHQGFYQAYKNLPDAQMISDLLNLKQKYPTAKTVISGHSLGAAMAHFAYLDACDALGKIDLLITYGSPRVGNSYFADFVKNSNCGERIRVVHYGDLIPHALLQLLGYKHASSEVFYSNDQSSSYVICEDSENMSCSNQIAANKYSFNDHLTYLNFTKRTGIC